MKVNKLILAMSLSMVLASCDDSEKNVQNQAETTVKNVATQVQSGSNLMDFIPAETPILAVYTKDPKYPMPKNLTEKMDKLYDSVGEVIKMAISEKIDEESDEAKKAEIKAFTDKWFSEDGMAKLGFSVDELEMAVYTVDLFPVLRMTLAKSHSMGEILDEIVAKANESEADSAIKKQVSGHEVYQFGDKEIQIMVSLKGNSVAMSLAPTREVDNLMPKLMGFEKPQKNITQSNEFQDTINKYNYMSNSLYWINFRDLADYFVNSANHQSAMLDMMKVQDNMFSADCKTEILAMVDKFPRLVGGGKSLSEHQMESQMVFEMEDGLGTKMSTMTGRIPKASGNPAITYGFSFDIVAAKKLAQEFVTNIENEPYKCEMLSEMNEGASKFKAQLDQPLPPFVSNFKGFNVIIDELDLDMTKQDPSEMVKNLKANMLLAVDNPEALKGMAEMMMPELQEMGIVAGGDAVNISSMIPVQGSQIPVNLDHLFFAMGDETLGLSLGEGTDVELTNSVSGESDAELFNMKVTSELYKNIFAGIGDMAASFGGQSSANASMQKLMNEDMLWWDTQNVGVLFTDNGLEFNMDIKY